MTALTVLVAASLISVQGAGIRLDVDEQMHTRVQATLEAPAPLGPLADTETLLAEADGRVGGDGFFARTPYERLTVREAVLSRTGIDLRLHADGASLKRAVERACSAQ